MNVQHLNSRHVSSLLIKWKKSGKVDFFRLYTITWKSQKEDESCRENNALNYEEHKFYDNTSYGPEMWMLNFGINLKLFTLRKFQTRVYQIVSPFIFRWWFWSKKLSIKIYPKTYSQRSNSEWRRGWLLLRRGIGFAAARERKISRIHLRKEPGLGWQLIYENLPLLILFCVKTISTTHFRKKWLFELDNLKQRRLVLNQLLIMIQPGSTRMI